MHLIDCSRSRASRFRIVVSAFLAVASSALVFLARPLPAQAAVTMTGSTPARYSLAVSPDIPEIRGFFSTMLNPVPTGTVRVAGSMSGLHTGEVVTADNVIIFRNQSGPFFRGEVVHVNYRSDITAFGTGDELTGGGYFAFTVSSAPTGAPWSHRIGYDAEVVPYFIYGGDLDEDGTPDVAVPNEDTNNISVFLNTGGFGAFAAHTNYGVGARPSSIFGEDFDNDGDQDLATADINAGTVSVLLNNGNGTFAPRQVLTAGPTCRQVYGGDFDGDNDIDLCATSFGGGRVLLYYNPGNGVFPAGIQFTTLSTGPFTIRTADLDGDGHLDIAVGCRIASALNILTNNGTGGFTRTAIVTTSSWPWDLAANDMDGDHDCDLVAAAANGNQLAVHFNDGSGAFPANHLADTGILPLGVHVADLDGDGDLDALSSNYTGAGVGVYANPGNGVIALQSTLPCRLAGSYAWAHDLDGDGDLDVSVVDEEADSLFVFYRGSETTSVEGGSENVAAPGDTGAGLALRVAPNVPNPFGPATTIHFTTATGGHVRAAVHAVTGDLVATILDAELVPGDHQVTWNGRDARGHAASGGVYYLRVAGRGEEHVVKMTLRR